MDAVKAGKVIAGIGVTIVVAVIATKMIARHNRGTASFTIFGKTFIIE